MESVPSVKKALYKRTWFIIAVSIFVVVPIIIMIIGAIMVANETPAEKAERETKYTMEKHQKDSIYAITHIDEIKQDSIKNSSQYKDSVDKIKNPIKYLKADITWKKGGFDMVALADITIINDGSKTALDIEVEITFVGESGKELNNKRETLTILLLPNTKKIVKNMNLGFIDKQVYSASIEVKDSQFK